MSVIVVSLVVFLRLKSNSPIVIWSFGMAASRWLVCFSPDPQNTSGKLMHERHFLSILRLFGGLPPHFSLVFWAFVRSGLCIQMIAACYRGLKYTPLWWSSTPGESQLGICIFYAFFLLFFFCYIFLCVVRPISPSWFAFLGRRRDTGLLIFCPSSANHEREIDVMSVIFPHS